MDPKHTSYIAKRGDDTVTARKLTITPDLEWKFAQLPARTELRDHSPAGFEFGYAGSGPAQLSLAILADALGPERAFHLYQKFKREFVARAAGDEFKVTLEAIQEWAAKQSPPPDALDAWGDTPGD